MSLTPPTVAQLSEFSGRPESEYSEFATQALAQATLLMEFASGLDSPPTSSAFHAQLFLNGILDAADHIYLSQQYKAVRANPFASETIGSYSYTKASAAVQRGEPTGMTWFDMAVTELGVKTQIFRTQGVSVFEKDDLARDPETGDIFVAGPSDRDNAPFPFYTSQPGWDKE